ncbi:MAG: hypothetical protein ABW161_17065 [Candidatus Thiodiazotropha sp.]
MAVVAADLIFHFLGIRMRPFHVLLDDTRVDVDMAADTVGLSHLVFIQCLCGRVCR